MAIEYKVLSASSASALTTAVNAEAANGFYVFGSVSCSTDSDTVNAVSELYSVMMQRQTE